MNKEELDHFKKVVSITARKLGFINEAEDMASHILLRRLDGGGKKQNIYYAVIDYLRTNSLGTRRGEPKKTFFELSHEDGEENAEVTMALQFTNKTISREYRDSLSDFEKTIEACELKKDERALIVLYYVYGFDLREIGGIFGVTESAMSIRKSVIESKIKEAVKKNDTINK